MMSENWDEDGKANPLAIPGMALPGFRDLRVQFIALIEWDMFLGPVVHIKELSSGSSYIKKLRDYQTLSEVYAGVARADVDILTTPEDVIAVFRYDRENESEATAVLLISCIPETEMEPIRIIGSRALTRSKGDPQIIGKELSLSLREFQTAAQTFERSESGVKIKIISDGQILKPLDFEFLKGFCMIDLESNIADFRFFPRYFEGRDLDPSHILNYLDRQFEFVQQDLTTSLLYNGLFLVINRVKAKNIFFLNIVENPNLVQIMQVGEWIKLSAKNIEEEWRFATDEEIILTLSILEKSFHLNSPPEFISNYLHTSMISNKLKPITVNFDKSNHSRPEIVKEELWEVIDQLDGNHSILELSKNIDEDAFSLIKFLEWGKYRNIIEYLKS